MKKIIFLALVCFISCVGEQKKTANSGVQKNVAEISVGWGGDDSYTVQVIATNQERALEHAKLKILEDIVSVRMHNNSQYTDISKIKIEFDKPIGNGKVIRQINRPDNVAIWFQIKEKGLKEKFERK